MAELIDYLKGEPERRVCTIHDLPEQNYDILHYGFYFFLGDRYAVVFAKGENGENYILFEEHPDFLDALRLAAMAGAEDLSFVPSDFVAVPERR